MFQENCLYFHFYMYAITVLEKAVDAPTLFTGRAAKRGSHLVHVLMLTFCLFICNDLLFSPHVGILFVQG